MLQRMKKKGDLNLSINAIVVLILAITMLGLGLGFMRNMFSKTTSQFEEVGSTMKDQIINDIKASNQRLAFNSNEIPVKKGDKKDVFYGIYNDLPIPAGVGTPPVIPTSQKFSVSVGCYDALDTTANPSVISFNTFTVKDVKYSEIAVQKLTVTVPSTAKVSTYSCVMFICSAATTPNPCSPMTTIGTTSTNSYPTATVSGGTLTFSPPFNVPLTPATGIPTAGRTIHAERQFYVVVQ